MPLFRIGYRRYEGDRTPIDTLARQSLSEGERGLIEGATASRLLRLDA